jgi:hypothetical protein
MQSCIRTRVLPLPDTLGNDGCGRSCRQSECGRSSRSRSARHSRHRPLQEREAAFVVLVERLVVGVGLLKYPSSAFLMSGAGSARRLLLLDDLGILVDEARRLVSLIGLLFAAIQRHARALIDNFAVLNKNRVLLRRVVGMDSETSDPCRALQVICPP